MVAVAGLDDPIFAVWETFFSRVHFTDYNLDSVTLQFTPSTDTLMSAGFGENPEPVIDISWPNIEPDLVVEPINGKTANWYLSLGLKEALYERCQLADLPGNKC